MSARLLCTLLTEPEQALTLTPAQWTQVLTVAHAERLSGSLAHRLAGLELPVVVRERLGAARRNAEAGRTQALWEVEMARRALAHLALPIVLLKGSAFVAAGLDAGVGRQIGDLDILVPREKLDDVEAALLGAGWEWVKPNAYDDMYYRRWMHELPPLIHRERDRMIDVHHTISPLTARPKPDAPKLIACATPLGNGLSVLTPEVMVVHAAAHLIADGDMEGGLRNLWDIDRLVREATERDPDFHIKLAETAQHHDLANEVNCALRLAKRLFATPLSEYRHSSRVRAPAAPSYALFVARLTARNGWGQPTRKPLRLAFYIRSHLLRMPPLMLMRHLWIKARTVK